MEPQAARRRGQSKYLEDCLRRMLEAVRSCDLERVAEILREEPAVEEGEEVGRAIERRCEYLLNELGEAGRNALHEAIQAGSADIVSFLLIKGADPARPTADDASPLQLAVLARAPDLLALLLQQPRANPNQVTALGTALHVAAAQEDAGCIEALFKSDADTETVDNSGRRAVEVAGSQSIRRLLERKAELRNDSAPFITRGDLFRVSSLTCRLKQRTLLLNPFKDEFVLTDSKDRQERFAVSLVEGAEEVEERGWLMSSDFAYFRVRLRDKERTEIVLAVRHQPMLEQWVASFRAAVRFRENAVFAKAVPAHEQLIQLLDDAANTRTVHKRRADPPRKSPSILALLPGEDEPDHALRIRSRLSLRKSDRRFANLAEEFVAEESQIVLGSMVRGMEGSMVRGTEGSMVRGTEGSPSEYASVVESTMEPSFLDRELTKDRFRKNSMNKSEYVVSEFDRPSVSFREFRVVRVLGRGSFGEVVEAVWERDGRTFALKILSKQRLIKKKQLKYAVGEATILKKLDHPFVITLHLAFQTPQSLYLALDHCPHGDLAELITVRERLHEPTARFILAQLLLALEYLHARGILHRDLKPENVLIAADRYVRLADFGLSREKSHSMSFCGSPAYLSPEMLERKGVGFAADIYGLGCILFEMLTGEPPFFDEDLNTLYDNIRTGKLRYPSHLSVEAKSLLSKLLERDANKRLGSKNISDIKAHDFFRKFEWAALLERRAAPPAEMVVEDVEEYYEVELEPSEPITLSDTDYDATTDKANRIKHFTFVRNH